MPIPFSKRETGITAVFAAIFIASGQGAQAYTIGTPATGILQAIFAALTGIYQRMLNQNNFATEEVGPFIEGAGNTYTGAVPPAPIGTLLTDAQTQLTSLVATVNAIPANAQPYTPFQQGAPTFSPQVPQSTVPLTVLQQRAAAVLAQVNAAIAAPDDGE